MENETDTNWPIWPIRGYPTREQIARSLEDSWRKELLIILVQERNLYQIYQRQIAECDTAMAAHL